MSEVTQIVQAVLARRVLLLDGATGTELTRRGVPTPLPLWSTGALRDHPDVVRAIHCDYVKAGADIIVANTFRANVRTLRSAGMLKDGETLNRCAVELARQGVIDGLSRRPTLRGNEYPEVMVAASVAPVEDCYHPERVPDESTLVDEHGRMMAWLSTAGLDLIWIETINTVREARAAARAASNENLPFVVSFVVRENGDLLSGEALEDAIAAVEPFEPLAIGLNCIPPEGMTRSLPRLRAGTRRPLIAYAHLGNPEPISGWSFAQDLSAEEYAEHAVRWIEIGARIVGGCCGTTPAHIAALRPLVDAAS